MQSAGVSNRLTLLLIVVENWFNLKAAGLLYRQPDACKWNPYIKAGAESWNKAFEKIGFKDVICVKEFPKNDTLFNANSLDCMTVRYSASWMNSAQTTIHSDSRTGEILNASILINANMISVQYADRVGATVAIDPRVRTTVFRKIYKVS